MLLLRAALAAAAEDEEDVETEDWCWEREYGAGERLWVARFLGRTGLRLVDKRSLLNSLSSRLLAGDSCISKRV